MEIVERRGHKTLDWAVGEIEHKSCEIWPRQQKRRVQPDKLRR